MSHQDCIQPCTQSTYNESDLLGHPVSSQNTPLPKRPPFSMDQNDILSKQPFVKAAQMT